MRRSLKRFDGVALHKRMLDLDRERIAAWDVVATLSGLHGAFAAIATAREPDAVVAALLGTMPALDVACVVSAAVGGIVLGPVATATAAWNF